MARLPLSVLDLATVSVGSTSAQALAEATVHAQRADELGYLRFWVAEHHNMATVASTTPGVLIAHIAANTRRIRVGSGGVMLPNHAPLAIAEQFALLEAMHPDRIDLGIGRAPGTDQATALALRGPGALSAEDFPENLIDVMGLLGDVRAEEGLWTKFMATPAPTSSPQILLLGSSGFSAQLAGLLGLPFGYANHFDMGGPAAAATALYREHFRPSPVLDRPYTIISASTMAADDHDEAHHLAGPAKLRKYGMRTGRLLPLLAPEQAATHPDFERAVAMPSSSIIGTAEEVRAGLDILAAETHADEVMVYTPTFSLAERLRSLELVAQAWGLEAPAA